MANYNRDQGNRPFGNNQGGQDDQFRGNQNEYNRNLENEGSYGNAGFENDYNQRNRDRNRQNNVNYIPDNDDNRHDYGNRNTQSEGYAGSGNNLGQQRNQWGNQWGSHYGASFGNQSRQSGQGNYGGQSGWGSVNDNSGGYDINSNNRFNQQRGNQDQWQQQRRGDYGNTSEDRHGVNYGGAEANAWNNTIQNKDDRGWWDRDRTDKSSWMSSNDENRVPRGNRNNPITGEHRGKGPRGYQRSDDRIKEDVCDRMSDDDMLDASEIEVEVNGSEIVLSGTVLSREAKRHAEDIAESVSGVRHVENRIRVGRADELEGNYTTRQIIRAAGNDESKK